MHVVYMYVFFFFLVTMDASRRRTYLILGEDEHVPGGQIAMYQPLVLQVRHAVAHLHGQLAQPVHGEAVT